MEEVQEPCEKEYDPYEGSNAIKNQAGEESQKLYVWIFQFLILQRGIGI